MPYQVKIIYPKEEAAENNKLTERTFNEFIDELETPEVITQYEQLLTRGYSISVNFAPPELDEKGGELDPFKIAGRFELAGIPYKATLKLKASGNYEAMAKVAKIIEQQGFDYDISVKLQISEEHYKVNITLKAKVKKDDDDSFANQLAAYPSETLVIFKLSDADIYGE